MGQSLKKKKQNRNSDKTRSDVWGCEKRHKVNLIILIILNKKARG